MNKILNTILMRIFARPSIKLATLWPSYHAISIMRKLYEIQLSTEQLKIIATTVRRKAPCNLLIFGLGNDSEFWANLNQGGVTIFIEDNQVWFQKVSRKSKQLICYLVNYNTQRKDWRMLLESPSRLSMVLPDDVEKTEWDIILVDAPAGWNEQTPGRMKSIFNSARLIKVAGDIFVHDCNREIENIYCNTFLKKENLKTEINAPMGLLRHYHIRNCSN